MAKQVSEKKRMDWRAKNSETAKKIDELVRKEKWFDFHVLNFDGHRLTVAGSIDLIYYHNLEVIFEDIFFVSGFLEDGIQLRRKLFFKFQKMKSN